MPTSARTHCTVFTEAFGKFVTSQWIDAGIDPYNGIRQSIQIRIVPPLFTAACRDLSGAARQLPFQGRLERPARAENISPACGLYFFCASC